MENDFLIDVLPLSQLMTCRQPFFEKIWSVWLQYLYVHRCARRGIKHSYFWLNGVSFMSSTNMWYKLTPPRCQFCGKRSYIQWCTSDI
jgi:hypothetical protein